MKLVRTLTLALGLTLSSGALAGAALADEPCEEGYQNDGWQDDGWQNDGDQNDAWQGGRRDTQWTGGRWDGRGDHHRPDRGDRWDGWTAVRFVNLRDQPVTLFLNGQFLARIAPNSRERVTMPVGNHIVTYQVGWRQRYHQISVSAFEGQRNRVVIEGRRHWGGYGW